MGKSSRTKGVRGEQEVSLIFRAYGFTTWRTPNSGAFTHAKGDLNGIAGWHVEIKRQETVDINRWWRQAVADAPEGDKPVVIFRRSGERWKAVIHLDDYIRLIGGNVYEEEPK